MAERTLRLSDHFTLGEFAMPTGKLPPKWSWHEYRCLAQSALTVIRANFGPVHITSGYRDQAYNIAVGGAKHSYHTPQRDRVGVAADFYALRGDPSDWYEALDWWWPCGLGRYTTHVHVDTRATGRARW